MNYHYFIQVDKPCWKGIQPNMLEGEKSFAYWYILQILFSQLEVISCIAAMQKYK